MTCSSKLRYTLYFSYLPTGNTLRDSGCAKVIEAVAYSETIEGLDLSNNKIGRAAKETINILTTLKLRHEEYCFRELHLGMHDTVYRKQPLTRALSI